MGKIAGYAGNPLVVIKISNFNNKTALTTFNKCLLILFMLEMQNKDINYHPCILLLQLWVKVHIIGKIHRRKSMKYLNNLCNLSCPCRASYTTKHI